MLYAKNLPTWERSARLLAALLLVAGAYHFRGDWVGVALAVTAIGTAMTAVLGFCPACALAGRRLDARRGKRT